MNTYKEKLAEEYKKIFEKDRNKPDWAVKKKSGVGNVHPAIPFVGESYEKTRLLLYASAENMTKYEKEEEWYADDNDAMYRRYSLGNEYFPSLYMKPVTDGPLLVVAAYILKKLNIDFNYSCPYEFIKNIAIDNFGKFSRKTTPQDRVNKDYAGNERMLNASYEYIKRDLEILEPKIIILPKTIFNHENVKSLLPNNCKIFPIYQINARNINLRISKQYEKKNRNEIPEIFLNWQKNLKNGISKKTNDNFDSVYTYLDKLLCC